MNLFKQPDHVLNYTSSFSKQIHKHSVDAGYKTAPQSRAPLVMLSNIIKNDLNIKAGPKNLLPEAPIENQH